MEAEKLMLLLCPRSRDGYFAVTIAYEEGSFLFFPEADGERERHPFEIDPFSHSWRRRRKRRRRKRKKVKG